MWHPAITRTVVAAALALLGASCTRPDPDLHEDVVLPWLTCIECVDGELEAVLELGEDAVPALALALDGPSREILDAVSNQFTEHWDRTARYLVGEGRRPPISRTDFLSANVAAFVVTYRSRAAAALGEIGGSDAQNALDRALDEEMDVGAPGNRVLNAFDQALGRIDGGL